jgi:cytochrome c-type biogenesis protein CcmH/NrfG
MTSGFVMDDFNKLETISMIHSLGAWNHFVHPDDVIPTPGRYQENVREDENLDVVGWYHKPKNDGLFYRFRTWLQFVKEYFPWLRSLTLSGARDIVLKYAASASTVVSLGNQVRFSATKAPAFYMFYLPGNNRILSVNGGTIIHDERMEFSKYYVLESSNGEMVATLKDSVASMDFQGPEQGDLYHTRGLARNDVLIPETLAETSAAVAAQSDLRQADAFIAAGKQRDAINLLEQSSRRRPNDVGIWSKLRQLYDWNNKPDKALKACETVVRLDPSDLAAMKILAQRYVWVNRQDDAVRMYEKILRREPKNITVLKTLAELCVGSSRQQEAIPLYERILRQEPKNVKLRKTLADLYFWNSKNERGIGEYQRILKIDKADTAVIRLLAEKYLEMDRQADALRLYEHLLAHRSDDVELRKRLAQVYTWNNEGQKAVEQYEAILAINGTDSQTKKTLARMYVENNNLDKAIVQLKEILQEDPKDITSLKRLGELYLWRERQKEALPLYEKIVAAEPDSLSYRLMLGRLYAWTKNPVAAKKQFAEVVKRDRSSIEALSQLADIERSEGEWKLAMSHYEQVLSVDAQNKEARSAVEDIRREHGLLFRTSYERIEDSNDLTREQVPLAAGLLQAGDWQLGIHAVRQSIRDRRLNESGQGYGIGFDGLYTLNQDMSLSTVLLATSYTSGWIPVSLVLQVNGTLTPRLYSAVKLKRSETTEGVQAVKSKIFLNSAGGELYFQTTNRLSFSGSAEADFYSDDNTKLTLASFSTYKLMLGNPTIALLANYAYQDSKVIYPSSVPYWTPSKLSTTSFGIDVTAGLFESVSIEAAYLNTLQAGVFSSNVRAQISLHPSAFSEVLIYYEKLGSKVYSQNTLRAIIQYRY